MSPAHFWSQLSKLTRSEIKRNEPMARYTTMKVGGPSDYLCAPVDEAELVALVRFARQMNLGLTVLGHGSNVVVADQGIRGITIKLEPALTGLEIEGERLKAGAGAALSKVIKESLAAGLVGLEGLAGVPGSVGGAVIMNAGTHYGAIGDRVESVRIYELSEDRVVTLPGMELGFRYRWSALQHRECIVLTVALKLERAAVEAARELVQELLQQRRATQPLQWSNSGSVFENPPGDYAGRLIEAAGLKGLRHGGAQVSKLHANFIINTGGATAADVLLLIREIQARVRQHSGIRLKLEIRFLGDWLSELHNAYMGALVEPDPVVS